MITFVGSLLTRNTSRDLYTLPVFVLARFVFFVCALVLINVAVGLVFGNKVDFLHAFMPHIMSETEAFVVLTLVYVVVLAGIQSFLVAIKKWDEKKMPILSLIYVVSFGVTYVMFRKYLSFDAVNVTKATINYTVLTALMIVLNVLVNALGSHGGASDKKVSPASLVVSVTTFLAVLWLV